MTATNKGEREEISDDAYRNKEWLREKYVTEGLTQADIAEVCDSTQSTISYWIRKHDIEHSHSSYEHKRPSKSWLQQEYHDKERTQYEIADELGVSQGVVWRWFEQLGIESRDKHAAQGIGQNSPLRDSAWLREKYLEEKNPTRKIAAKLGVTDYCVRTFLEKYNINTRDVVGKNHPQWEGGERSYGPGWNESKREQIYNRDRHRCRDCGLTQSEHKVEYDERLHVHHLIKARDIDDPEERNALENLITLCRDCHVEWEKLSDAGIRPQGIDAVGDWTVYEGSAR